MITSERFEFSPSETFSRFEDDKLQYEARDVHCDGILIATVCFGTGEKSLYPSRYWISFAPLRRVLNAWDGQLFDSGPVDSEAGVVEKAANGKIIDLTIKHGKYHTS